MIRVVGAIKCGIAGGLPGVVCGAAVGAGVGVTVASGPFGCALAWTAGLYVGALSTLVGAARGAVRGFITKGN